MIDHLLIAPPTNRVVHATRSATGQRGHGQGCKGALGAAVERGSLAALGAGSKAFISGGGSSEVYLVMACTGPPEAGPKGISAFLVDKVWNPRHQQGPKVIVCLM
jgi:isobutyryl-CoA dehydrogenase